MKPNIIGSKVLYLNPSTVAFSTAELAAIDTVDNSPDIYPYAYTGTVANNYDSYNIDLDACDIATQSKVSFGVFLSPENDKGSLLFQVNIAGKVYHSGSSAFSVEAFFGRKATNNTVTSSKAGANNLLSKYIVIPAQTWANADGAGKYCNISVNSELFSLSSAGEYVYCAGITVTNLSGSTAASLRDGLFTISLRKYNSELTVFEPSRV